MKKYHGKSCLVFRNLIEDIGMNSAQGATRENNLASLGYVDFDNPSEISIYPVDFDSKEHVAEILSAYNSRMEAEGMDDQVITYTDMVGTLMSSVTDIIDIISYVLIAFVAISLVVSSIMIGVITYISVPGTEKGDRDPQGHRRFQREYLPGLQRRDFHNRTVRRTDRHRTDAAFADPRQRADPSPGRH